METFSAASILLMWNASTALDGFALSKHSPAAVGIVVSKYLTDCYEDNSSCVQPLDDVTERDEKLVPRSHEFLSLSPVVAAILF
jgi:hypothetical protein